MRPPPRAGSRARSSGRRRSGRGSPPSPRGSRSRVGCGLALEQRGRADDLARRAEPALERVLGNERLLYGARRAPAESPSIVTISWPSAASARSRQEFTGRAVDEHGAGAAGALAAGELRPEQLEIVAEHGEQAPAVRLHTCSCCPLTSSVIGIPKDYRRPPRYVKRGRIRAVRRASLDSRAPRERRAPRGRLRRLVGRERRHDDRATTTTTTSASATEAARTSTCPPPREDGGATAPKERLDPEKTYKLVFKTNCGSFTVTLDLDSAPATAASLVSLAKPGFFDDTVFHRIVPGFVIQGGDPTQTGTGGPGYKTVDPPRAGRTLREGRRRDGEDRGRGRRARRGASSSSSRGPTSACRRTTRSSAR